MGIDITKLVGDAFGIIEQVTTTPGGTKVVEETTIRIVTGSTYNTATAKTEKTYSNETVRAVWTRPKQKEIEGIVDVREKAKVLIPSSDFTTEPTVDDLLIRANGSEWDVRQANKVPGESLLTLIVLKRKS